MFCSKCQQDKGVDFPPQKRHGRRNGLHYTCRDCYAENARRLGRRNAAFMRALKNSPCVDCGLIYHPTMMDFDHRPGTVKRCNVGIMATWSLQKLAEEIEKCDLVCVLCHRVRTWNRIHPDDIITRFPIGEDIVRASQRCEEVGGNDQPRLVKKAV